MQKLSSPLSVFPKIAAALVAISVLALLSLPGSLPSLAQVSKNSTTKPVNSTTTTATVVTSTTPSPAAIQTSTLQILDAAVKCVQIAFFVVGGACTFLTYRALTRGWLNSVNTEYQKKVIDRLASVAQEIWSEFDETSPFFWGKSMPVQQLIDQENEEYLENSDVYQGISMGGGYFVTGYEQRLGRLIEIYKTDPFLPNHIRDRVVELLESRKLVTSNVFQSLIVDYRKWLNEGPRKTAEQLKNSWYVWQNPANAAFNEQGCGITDIENEINVIRLTIQQYFESFSPVKARKK